MFSLSEDYIPFLKYKNREIRIGKYVPIDNELFIKHERLHYYSINNKKGEVLYIQHIVDFSDDVFKKTDQLILLNELIKDVFDNKNYVRVFNNTKFCAATEPWVGQISVLDDYKHIIWTGEKNNFIAHVLHHKFCSTYNRLTF